MAIETFGSIIKEEKVKTVINGTIPNTLVLENLGLFPGYYGAEMPKDKMPDSFFIGIADKESTEKIFRITHNIKKESGLEFEGTPANICIHNDTYNTVRIRGIKTFEQVGELQAYYRDAGLTLLKKKNIEDQGVIQIKKIFKITELAERIYKDEERNMYYLRINEQLTWSHFKTITKKLRNNITISAFDAALAVFYASEIYDLIRIYTKTLTMDDLHTLHKKYEEIITHSLKH